MSEQVKADAPAAEPEVELATRDQIFNTPDLTTEDVFVPEWNSTVRVREAMACEQDDYDSSLYSTDIEDDKVVAKNNLGNAKARLVVKCVIDKKAKRVFVDADAERLGTKSYAAVNLLFQTIQKLNGQTKKAKKAIEGNLSAGQGENSPSSSPAT